MTKKLVSFDDQAEPGEGLPAAVRSELNATYGPDAWSDPESDVRQAAVGAFAPSAIASAPPAVYRKPEAPAPLRGGVSAPSAGTTVDAEARSSVAAILTRLREVGLIGFSPADIPGLHAWYDARAIAGVAAGAAVPSWADGSGNSRALSQATTAKQPTYSADGLNGFPALRFTAANVQSLTSATFTAVAQPVTVFVVARNNGTTVPAAQVLFDGVGSGANRRQINLQPAPKWGITNNLASVSSPYLAPLNAGEIVTAQFDDTTHLLRFGGVESTGAGAVAAGNPTAWRVGANNADASPWDGWIGEVIVYAGKLTRDQIGTVESYLASKWGVLVAQPGIRYIDTTGIGSDSNHGQRPDAPKASVAGALSTITAPSVTLRYKTSEASPIRWESATWLTWNDPRPLLIEPWSDTERVWMFGSIQTTSGWTAAGGGVYSRTDFTKNPLLLAVTTLPNAEVPDLPVKIREQTTNLTAPAEGHYTWEAATSTLRVRLPGSADANTHAIEVPVSNQAIWQTTGSGRIRVRRATARYWRNAGFNIAIDESLVAPVGALGHGMFEDCEASFSSIGFAIDGPATALLCYNCQAFYNNNDGFNVHGSGGNRVVTELWNCEGAYNDDEGASPHDDTILRVYGGHFHHNRSGGGITGVDRCHMDISGAVVNDNRTLAQMPDEGGVSFYDAAMTGSVSGLVAAGNNGPGLYVRPGAKVIRRGVTSGTGLGNKAADQ